MNDAFCRKWLQSVDKGGLSGFRCVRDDSGQRHIIGFGMADVKGLSGKRIVNALRLSRMRVVQSVAFALKSDVVMSEILEKGMIKGSGDIPSTWENFTSSVVLKCSRYIPPIEDVYDGYVKHSLTGRDIYMTVCAVCMAEEKKE